MCDAYDRAQGEAAGTRSIPIKESVGTVLAHDITEIRRGEFKGRAFRRGHVIREQDICHLQRLGKERLYILEIKGDEMHEDAAARALAQALVGEGVAVAGEPREGKINIAATRDGLLKVDKEALLEFNMLGEVMCATLHDNTVVKSGHTVAGTRAIPLVVKHALVERAGEAAQRGRGSGVIEVLEMRKPRAGVVITGGEVYYGRIKDAFGPIIRKKIEALGGEVVGEHYAPDDEAFIETRLRGLIEEGADLLVTTGGMSVDPDDVTRFAVRALGAKEITYGSPVLPGAMFLIAYIDAPNSRVPVLGIPACGMYHKTTVFDLILPRVLAGETIGRKELAGLGHGGLCLNCSDCRYPVCPFGKGP
jgi:hypothetical protein